MRDAFALGEGESTKRVPPPDFAPELGRPARDLAPLVNLSSAGMGADLAFLSKFTAIVRDSDWLFLRGSNNPR